MTQQFIIFYQYNNDRRIELRKNELMLRVRLKPQNNPL